MVNKKVCMFVTNPVTNDPRVRREAASLAKHGYRVVVVGLRKSEEDPEQEWIDGYLVQRFSSPGSLIGGVRTAQEALLLWLARTSPRMYRRLRSAFRKAGLSSRTGEALNGEMPTEPQHSAVSSTSPFPSTLLGRLRTDLRSITGMVYLNLKMVMRSINYGADVYHAHDLNTLLGAYLASRLTGAKLVYDFHELYTEQFAKGVKTWLWHQWYDLLEHTLSKRADLRLTVCDSLGEWLNQRRRVQGVVTVKNVPMFQEPLSARAEERNEKLILYHGLYFRNRGLEQLIEASQYLEGGKVVLRGYGYLEDQLRAMVKEKCLNGKVTFAAPVPMTELVKTAAEADIGVGAFVPHALNTRFALPNKLFEYMMAGLAVVGSDLPEMRKVILGHNIGKVCRPDDPYDLARVLNEILNDESQLEIMRRNALRAARIIYNWDVEQHVLLKAYKSLG